MGRTRVVALIIRNTSDYHYIKPATVLIDNILNMHAESICLSETDLRIVGCWLSTGARAEILDISRGIGFSKKQSRDVSIECKSQTF